MSVRVNLVRITFGVIAGTALVALSALAPITQPAGASFGATYAGWTTAQGLFPDEASALFTVPQTSPSGSGLIAWVGLGAGDEVFQAGAGVDASAGLDGCFWADYPATNSVAIPGLRCAPGDLLFVDIAQAFYGATQSRVIVIDVTSGQSTGWMSVLTPDLAWSPEGEALVEANASLGPAPSSFAPVAFWQTSFVRSGFVGSGGVVMTMNGLADLGLLDDQGSLANAISGVALGEDWAANLEAING